MNLSDFYKTFGSKKLRNAETAGDSGKQKKTRKESVGEKNGKVFIFFVVICVSFGAYAFKLFSMQVLEGSIYRGQSVTISSRFSTLPAQRGEIYDRNYDKPLVINIDSFAVDVIPGDIPSGRYDTVISRLAGYLGIKKRDIDEKIPLASRRSFAAIEVKSPVDFLIVQNIAENIADLPGVSWRSRPIRKYEGTGSLSHILGYVGNITNDELKILYNQGYRGTSIVGKTGIEKEYDLDLQGKQGTESRTVDARGKLVAHHDPVPPEPGKNLVLTIDTRIQTLAEEALGKRVGAVVVLKPASGEIAAMVSYPYFDASAMSGENAAAEYTKLAADNTKPLLNRAVNAVYPPASTFKVVMTTAQLTEGVFPVDKKVECTGNITLGNRTFNCHVKSGHGWLDLKNGLAQSCDVYYWTVGLDKLGVNRIAQYSRVFGLGQNLSLDLPSASRGFVPGVDTKMTAAEWKQRTYQEIWLGGDTLNMSIGQGYTLVTPLHIANMMAMVANGGVIYKPHFLKEIRDPKSGEVTEIQPEPLFQSNVPDDVWKQVQTYLRYTITNGTAQFPLHNRIVAIAGKTGTAEVAGFVNQWHSWFVAYAPFDAPPEEAYVVCVLVEAVNPWEWWAPYASNIIFQGIFANQTFDEAVDALGFRYMTRPVARRE